METFSKGSFTRLFQKMAPEGGAFYQISPDVALTTGMQRLLEMTPAICPLSPRFTVFSIQRPQNRGGLHENFLKMVKYPIYFQPCTPESLSP